MDSKKELLVAIWDNFWNICILLKDLAVLIVYDIQDIYAELRLKYDVWKNERS